MSNSVRRSSKNNEPEEENRQETILSVAPLSSAPYIGPPLPQSNSTSLPTKVDDDGIEKVGPAMIFMPRTTRNEWDTAVAATKSGVVLTGTAALGKLGSAVGLVDIGESEDSYLFRVSLPGVARDEKDFSFDIEPDGSILIKGITMTGEKIVCMDSQVFEMQTQNLCPPGHFTVSFQLPGPVDHQQCSALFGNDGTFEGKVKKM